MLDGSTTPRQPVAQLTITLFADGQVGIQGPLANRVLCHGMLAEAGQIVAAQARAPTVTVVEGGAGQQLLNSPARAGDPNPCPYRSDPCPPS